MHIHQAVNYVIVNYVIDNYLIEHGCRLVMESDSDMDIFAIYCYWKSNWKSAHWMYANYLTRVDARRRALTRSVLTRLKTTQRKIAPSYRRSMVRLDWVRAVEQHHTT